MTGDWSSEADAWYDNRMKAVVFDMDGVIHRGDQVLPGAVECVNALMKAGVRVGFLTNNSVRTREEIVRRLEGLGIHVEVGQTMNSGEATARHLVARGMENSRVYVIGGDGLAETLERSGFEVDRADEGEKCDFVIVGWDRSFSFAKIVRAQHEILVNRAKLIATNADPMFPAMGKLLPGAGAMVAAVEVASGTKAELIGKPKTISLEYMLDDLGIERGSDRGDVWVVGDRLDTDIACGKAYGARTVLVTTGITSRGTAENAPPELRPDYILDSLDELPDIL